MFRALLLTNRTPIPCYTFKISFFRHQLTHSNQKFSQSAEKKWIRHKNVLYNDNKPLKQDEKLNLLTFYSKTGNVSEFTKLWQQLDSPTAEAYNSYLRFHYNTKNFNEMAELANTLQRNNITIQPEVLWLLIRAFAIKKPNQILFQKYLEKAQVEYPDYHPDLDVLLDLLHMYINSNDTTGLLSFFDKYNPSMENHGWDMLLQHFVSTNNQELLFIYFNKMKARQRPTVENYLVLLKALKNQDRISQLILEMKLYKIKFDELIYSKLIEKFGEIKNKDKVLKYWNEMLDLNISPTESSYQSLIKAISHCGDFEQAYEFIEEMSNKELKVTDQIYIPIIFESADTRRALEDMESRGVKITEKFMHLLLDNPKCFTSISDVTELIDKLKKHQGITINEDTLEKVLEVCNVLSGQQQT